MKVMVTGSSGLVGSEAVRASDPLSTVGADLRSRGHPGRDVAGDTIDRAGADDDLLIGLQPNTSR